MINRKIIDKVLLSIILMFVIAFTAELSAQSKKEQIEILKSRVDSLKSVLQMSVKSLDSISKTLSYERISNNSRISDLQNKIQSLEQTNSKIISNYTALKDTIKLLSSEIDLLLKINSAPSFKSNSYDFDYQWIIYGKEGINHQDPLDAISVRKIIESKERLNLQKSHRAIRDRDLIIKLDNGEVIKFVTTVENTGNTQNYFIYLFEDLPTSKAYCLNLLFQVPGRGYKYYSLIQVDLKTGNKTIVSDKIGGEFYFSPNLDKVLITGWYDESDWVVNNQIKMVNLQNGISEFVINNVAANQVRWISNDEVSFATESFLIKNINWENDRPPYKVYDPLRKPEVMVFEKRNGNWLKFIY